MTPITDLSNIIAADRIDPAMATEAEVTAEIAAAIAAAIALHQAASFPHRPVGIEFAQDTTNLLDFHTALPPKDFDGRIIITGGGVTNGLASILFQFGNFQLNALFSLYGGAQLSRLLSLPANIDLPFVAAGASTSLTLNISGAIAGDLCFFNPTQMPAALAFFKIMAVITTNGVATIYFHNLGNSGIDLAPFPGRLLVLGFA